MSKCVSTVPHQAIIIMAPFFTLKPIFFVLLGAYPFQLGTHGDTQFVTGDNGEPNEVYPDGQCDGPTTNLDALFHTPLMNASASLKAATVSCLLELGADRTRRTPCGISCVDLVIGLVILCHSLLFSRTSITALCPSTLLLDLYCHSVTVTFAMLTVQ